jgi:NAD(P)-dependent dehydrogenase (short-subunit alcohol dehydrogenase family)
MAVSLNSPRLPRPYASSLTVRGGAAELAPAYVFLASRESRFITDEEIGVTGGKPIS